MKLLNKRALSTVAATAALTVVAIIQSEAAHAFLIQRTAGPLPPAGVNPSLAPPTVIDFDALSGVVPTAETTIGPGGPNGGATIQRSPGTSADYGVRFFPTDGLRIGGDQDGTVTFRFDDPRGMGYFGFFFQSISSSPLFSLSDITVSFLSGDDSVISSFTGTQLFDVSGNGDYFNFFVTNNGEIFNGVRFRDATGNVLAGGYIVDNVAYQAIPTPVLLPGLMAFALGAIRKRKAEAEAEG